MLVQLGPRSPTDDVVDLLIACHGRIRGFLDLARRLAAATPNDAETREAAGQIRRYFAVAFPLHLADEDLEILPRLSGRDAELDRALARMQLDHEEHAAVIGRLVSLCDAIEREPATLVDRSRELAETAAALSALLEPHLQLEERTLFPALRGLPQATRDEIRAAMGARRSQ